MLLLLALLVRVWLAWSGDFTIHPDEVMQYLEQGHRLLFGYGNLPWEYNHDARSWLVPMLVAALLSPFSLLGFDYPDLYVPGVKLGLCLLSLAIPVGMYRFASSHYGSGTALVALLLGLFWYEFVALAHKPLSEFVASGVFMACIAVAHSRPSRMVTILVPCLAVLAVAVRIHYVLAVLYLLVCWWSTLAQQQRRIAVLSASSATLAIGLFDLATVGSPWGSYANYFIEQVLKGRAASYGTAPFYLYLLWLLIASGGLIGAVAVMALRASTRTRHTHVLILIFLVLLPHLLAGHKEYRFIFLATPLWLLLVADGLTMLHGVGRAMAASVVITVSLLGMGGLLPGQARLYAWSNHPVDSYYETRPDLRVYRFLSRLERVTGVIDTVNHWTGSGGYYYLHHRVPLYDTHQYINELRGKSLDGFASHLLTRRDLATIPGFRKLISIDGIHIWERHPFDHPQVVWDHYHVSR